MLETREEIAELQRLFDRTLGRANSHMLGIVTPERRLTAGQVVAYLRGTKHVALATVTPKGEPRVSPVDSLFIHGRFTMGTGGAAARLRNLRANPACSAVHMDGERVAVVVNGTVEWLGRGHADREEVLGVWRATYGSDPYDLGPGVTLFRIEPASMWAFASRPAEFPDALPQASPAAMPGGAGGPR
jgi:Pyridoxamine 5'-phosphate oxidase